LYCTVFALHFPIIYTKNLQRLFESKIKIPLLRNNVYSFILFQDYYVHLCDKSSILLNFIFVLKSLLFISWRNDLVGLATLRLNNATISRSERIVCFVPSLSSCREKRRLRYILDESSYRFPSFPTYLLLVRSYQAEIIVKRLIQKRVEGESASRSCGHSVLYPFLLSDHGHRRKQRFKSFGHAASNSKLVKFFICSGRTTNRGVVR